MLNKLYICPKRWITVINIIGAISDSVEIFTAYILMCKFQYIINRYPTTVYIIQIIRFVMRF